MNTVYFYSTMEPPAAYRSPSTPGSAGAIADMRACAWHCWVAELRFCGVYLPVPLIAPRRIAEGYLVSQDMGPGSWNCSLFYDMPESFHAPARINHLMRVREARRSDDGAYLMHGEAWDDGRLKRWPQAWLCAGSEERVMAALQRMRGWLQQNYTGTYGTRA